MRKQQGRSIGFSKLWFYTSFRIIIVLLSLLLFTWRTLVYSAGSSRNLSNKKATESFSNDDDIIDALLSGGQEERIFSSSFSGLKRERYSSISGWNLCPTLEGSTFDTFTRIHSLGGSISSENPSTENIIKLIENEANDIFGSVKQLLTSKDLDNEDLLRFACYFAADGVNGIANITETRFLHHVNGTNYFPFLSMREEKISKSSSSKPYFKIAYQILVHDETGYENVINLVEKISSPDSIILIHVDLKAQNLKIMLKSYLKERLTQGGVNNVFLQRKAFGIIWGHISIVYAQLQGFFELMDIANWDYVINLSAFDWPLRSTADIYSVLQKNSSSSWIEYWKDPESSILRMIRPHVTLNKFQGMYNPQEIGLNWWPFPNHYVYKHHQWMILHRSFVKYLRSDEMAFNLLAFMEHTWIPDESFFATVAINTPEFANKTISNAKRYVRFEGGWHPIWLTWENRYDFLVGDQPEDGYFFIRKIDSKVQKDLIEFLDKKSFNLTPQKPCEIDDIGYRKHCFEKLLLRMASKSADNSIIIIPINEGLLDLGLNLYCSLTRFGLQKHAMFWSMDPVVHSILLSKKIVSYYNMAKFWGVGTVQQWHRGHFSRLMRQKLKIWNMIFGIGVNLWTLDADTVVVQDFTNVIEDEADIHVSIDEGQLINVAVSAYPVPNVCTGMMYIKNTVGARLFLDMVEEKLKQYRWMEDQEAVNKILKEELISKHSQIDMVNFQLADKWLSMLETVELSHHHKKKKLFHNSDLRVKVALLSQDEFVSGHFFFKRNREQIGRYHKSFKVIHANSMEQKETAFRNRGLWLISKRDSSYECMYY